MLPFQGFYLLVRRTLDCLITRVAVHNDGVPRESRLRIAEIFSSIQGEGIWVGTPSTFVRVSGCNLRCVWCDTPYASWKPEGPLVRVGAILDAAERAGIQHVVLTGGEPMLFEPIAEVAAGLKDRGHTITIETAGTIFRELPCDLMSISPKLANSIPLNDPSWKGRHDALRLNFPVLQQLVDGYAYQLKFVVNPEEGDDFAEIEAVLAKLSNVKPTRVLLMPEGMDSETLHRRARMLVQPVMERNWRLTQRLHIDLFGNKRGT